MGTRAALHLALLVALASAGACSGNPEGSRVPRSVEPTAAAEAARRAADPPCEAPAAAALLPGEPTAKRNDALVALLGGRPDDAIQSSSDVLDARPTDIAAYAVYSAAHRDAADRIEGVVRSAERATPLKVTFTPGRAVVRADAGAAPAPRPLVFAPPRAQTSNGAQTALLRKERGHVSPHASTSAATLGGLQHTLALTYPDHRIDVFGETTIVVTVDGSVARVFDVSLPAATFVDKNAAAAGGPTTDPRYLAPRIAQASGTDLFVAFFSPSDEATTAGQDGYLVAIDMVTGKMRWVSEPLTANDTTLLVGRDHVIASYTPQATPGTSTPPKLRGTLTAIDRASGARVARVAVAGTPNTLLAWKGDLTAITNEGHADIVSTPKIDPPPPVDRAKLGVGAAARVAPEHTRCRMTRVFAALDRRDADLAERELSTLTPEESVLNLTKALTGAARFLAEPAQNRRLDLTSVQPVKVVAAVPAPPPPNAKLPKLAVRKGKVVKGNDPAKPTDTPVRLPNVRGPKSPDSAIPEIFGRSPPDRSFVVDGVVFVVYGGRYLVTIERGAIRHVLDVRALVETEDGMFTVHHAVYLDGLLVVATGTPSSGSERRAGIVTAIRPDTGAIAWQSAPLACNTNFEVLRGRIVCAYGAPGEADAKKNPRLVLLRTDNGARETDLPLPSSPSVLDVTDDAIRVRGYNDVTTFAFQ